MKEIKASIDLGDNITKLIEQLAHQIGVTADKVFPWYVHQAVIEGYVAIILTVLGLIIGIAAIVCFGKKFKNTKEYDADEELHLPLLMGAGLVTLISLIAFFGSSQESIAKIINPEYYAFKTIISDVSRLSGR